MSPAMIGTSEKGSRVPVPFSARTVQFTVQIPILGQRKRDLHCCKSLSHIW